MRILLVLATSTGGVGTHVRALARDFAAEHQVGVCAPDLTLNHFDFYSLKEVEIFDTPIPSRIGVGDRASIHRLRSHIASFQPDVIHAHGFRAGLTALLAAGKTNVPVVVSWHNQASASGVKGWVEKQVETYIARRATLTLGASQDLVDRAQSLGAQTAVFAPVAAPRPTPVTDAARLQVRQELLPQNPPEALLGLAVGRVARQKNYELLIDIAHTLGHTPITFAVAGAADEEVLRDLKNLIQTKDLGQARIVFLGPRQDISALLAAADFYILTSHWEARALVVQEALVAGLPIIASAVGGIPDLVADAGIVIDPHQDGATQAFAHTIQEWRDPLQRELWATKARNRGEQLPNETEVAATILAHYHTVVDGD